MLIWPKQTKQDQKNYKIQNHKRVLVSSAKTRAKAQNILCTITEDDFEIPDECPYLKVPFQRGTMYAASLDKIHPELGYIPGNVEVISRKANLMKNNASVEELLEFAYTILERH